MDLAVESGHEDTVRMLRKVVEIDPATSRVRAKAKVDKGGTMGIVSIPLGFLGAILGTVCTREPSAEARFPELLVRANTGLGAEKATAH